MSVVTKRRAVPREFTDPRRNRLRNHTIIGLIVAMALMAPIAMVLSARASASASEAVRVATASTDSRHSGFATVVANQWAYDGGTPPAREGVDLGRPQLTAEVITAVGGELAEGKVDLGVKALTWVGASFSNSTLGVIEHHDFVVATPSGLLTLTISVGETPDGEPFLAARPAVAPYVGPNTERVSELEWGLAQTQPPERIQQRIGQWVDAFVADDRDSLFDLALTTEEERGNVAFVGLDAGFKVISSELVLYSATQDPEQALARVDMSVANADGAYLQLTYDLLIVDVTGAGAVVAWGPAGSGLSLVPGQNIVSPDATVAFGLSSTARTDAAEQPSGPSERAQLVVWLGRVADAQADKLATQFGYSSLDDLNVSSLLDDTNYRAIAKQAYFRQRAYVTPQADAYCVEMAVRDVVLHVSSDTPQPADGGCPEKWVSLGDGSSQ